MGQPYGGGGGAESRRWFVGRGGLAAIAGVGALTQGAGVAWSQAAAPASPPSQFGWGDGLKRIKSAGKIVFAQLGTPTPPLYYRDPDTKKPAGYDVEIANLIASDLGVAPVFEEAGVAARLSGLQSGKYDVAMGGTANTPARAELVAFTRGYLPYEQVLLVNAAARVQRPDELNKPGVTLTVAAGSTAADTARLIFPAAAIKPLPFAEALQAVVSGAATAILVELYIAAPFARSQPGVTLLGGPDKPIVIATEYGCLACSASEMALRQWLDNWIYWYESHGVLRALLDRTAAAAAARPR